MKEVKMYCDVCGKVFNQEYYEGGYNDHMNLVNNRHIFVNRARKDANYNIVAELAIEILLNHQRRIRHIDDIRARLDCVLKWDCLSGDIKLKVNRLVGGYLAEYTEAYEKVTDMMKEMKPMITAVIADRINSSDYYEIAFDRLNKQLRED